MLYIAGLCPLCEAGVRGFRLCSDGVTIVALCDECDSIWIDPRQLDISHVVDHDLATGDIPGLSCSIARPKSRWATRAEVEAAGWADLVHGETRGPGEP